MSKIDEETLKERFNWLISAARGEDNTDLALMWCENAMTGEKCAVLTIIQPAKDGGYNMFPVGSMSLMEDALNEYLPPGGATVIKNPNHPANKRKH